MRTPLLLSIVLLGACELTEDRFATTFAERYCAEFKACDETKYFRTFREGTPQCEELTAEDVDEQSLGNGNSACYWQPEGGEACLDRLAGASCDDLVDDDFVESCTEPAWDCIAIISP